jgi:mRNA interferase RelE/StbE
MNSARSIEFEIELNEIAQRQFLDLDPVVRDRLDRFLATGVARNPRRIGKALQGPLKGYWRYRLGHYRIICRIEDDTRRVVVVAVGHRERIYKGRI